MRFGTRSAALTATALALLGGTPAFATDVLMPGVITIIKDTKLFKVVAKPVSPAVFAIPAPNSGGDPLLDDGSLAVFDTSGGGILNDDLTGGTWTGLGNPAGSKGYKYKNTLAPAGGEVKIIILKEKVVKILAKDDETLNGPMSGNVGIILSTGTTPDRFCAEFGGSIVKNDIGLVKRKGAPAPGACPTVFAGCAGCNNHGFYNFTVTNSPGDCGDVIDAGGMVAFNINCAGLYTGGGNNSVPLPYNVPDNGSPVMSITSCVGSVASVGATSSLQTGSDRKCTSAGCSFGAPLAVPNPNSTPTSVCVLNRFASPPSGTVNCATGETTMALPLSAVIFLTGDNSTDPFDTIAGIQSCPLCSSGTCIGGPNDGSGCTAETSTLGGNPSYPTSNDCPPDPMANIGTLPVAFDISSGTVLWSGTNAANDTGSTASAQSRVFSGFCRDADGTGAFQQPFQECWRNGMAVGPACSGTFESCEQRSNGAFGPAGGNNRTIRAIGNAMSIVPSASAGTLVSVFSIAPTFDPTVDAAGDLPGPGAVALPVTAQTCASANSCP